MNRPMHASDVDQHSRFAVPLAALDELAMTVRCEIGAPIYTCGEPERSGSRWWLVPCASASSADADLVIPHKTGPRTGTSDATY